MCVGFIVPSLLIDQATQSRLALVGETPPGLEESIMATASAFDAGHRAVVGPRRGRGRRRAPRRARSTRALSVPRDLSTAGDLIVLEDAPSSLQAVVTQAVISLRAGPAASEPPAVVALEPPKAEDETALIFANAGIILMFIGIFSYGSWVLTGVVEEKQSRVVEVVLSTVRPRDLLMGKVLGIGLLALAQLVVLVAVGIGLSQLLGRLVLPADDASARCSSCSSGSSSGSRSTRRRWASSGRSRHGSRRRPRPPCRSPSPRRPRTSCRSSSSPAIPTASSRAVMTFLPPSAPMVVPLRTALGAIEPWEIVAQHGVHGHDDLGPVRRRRPGLLRARCSRPAAGSSSATPGARPADGGRRAPARRPRAYRKHPTRWSLTSPADCISA